MSTDTIFRELRLTVNFFHNTKSLQLTALPEDGVYVGQ